MASFLTSPVLPRRIIAGLIVLHALVSGMAWMSYLALGMGVPLTEAFLWAALILCKLAIGLALWEGSAPAWPAAVVIFGLGLAQIHAPAEAEIVIRAIALTVTAGLAVVVMRRVRRNGSAREALHPVT